MKLSRWAQQQGITYRTAWNWVRAGKMPVPVHITPTGTILVDEASTANDGVTIYARVSSAGQKHDLDRQVARLAEFASRQHLPVHQTVTEIASGLNGRRPRLTRLLANPTARVILVEHRDRLARFGCEYIEAALKAQGRRLMVMTPGEVHDDLVRDMLEILTSFCARLYGRRSARNRAQKAIQTIQQDARCAPTAVARN